MSNNNCIAQFRPSCLRPIEIRKSTDKLFMLLIPINLFLWLQLGIYEIWGNPISESKDFIQFQTDFNWNFSNFIIYGTVAVFVVVLFLYILNKMNDEWMIFVIICFIFSVILGLNLFSFCQLLTLIDSHLKFLLFTLTLTATCLIYHIVIFMCTREVNVHVLANTIKEPFGAIFHSPMVFILSSVITFWSIIVLIITVTITMIVMQTMGQPTVYTIGRLLFMLRICTFIYGGIFVLNFIWNYGFAIIADYCANYYSTSRNEKISRSYIFQSTTRVTRYHVGTIAFISMPILPSLCAIIVALKNNEKVNKQSRYTLITFISKICLITDVTDYVLIQTTVYGYESLKSIRKMFDLHCSNPLLFLSLNSVFVKAMEISILIALTVGMIIQRTYISHEIDTHYQLSIDVILAATYVNLINKFFMRPAMCTWLVYQLAGFRKSNNRILSYMS